MLIKRAFYMYFFDELSSNCYNHKTTLPPLFCYLPIMVEAIRYTHMPLENEKTQVIHTAVMELTDTIMRQDQRLDIIEDYLSQHLDHINQYQSGSIDFVSLLQKLQPLQTIPNPDNNKNIDTFNTIVLIINALNYSPHHESILQTQCTRLQELLKSNHMSFVIEELVCWQQ